LASAASERLDTAARGAVEASALAAPVVALAASDLARPADVVGVTQEADFASGSAAAVVDVTREAEREEVVAVVAVAIDEALDTEVVDRRAVVVPAGEAIEKVPSVEVIEIVVPELTLPA